MPKKWEAEITKRLVSLYELQPVLYKQDLPTYHNQLLRHKALEAIKEDLQCTFKEQYSTEEILKKINNLRSQFLEVTKKKKVIPASESGAEECVKPNWWLYDSLTFLLPYTKKDKGASNLNVSATQNLLPVPNSQETTVEISGWEGVFTEDDHNENVNEPIVQTDPMSPASFAVECESSHSKSSSINSDSNRKNTPKTRKRGQSDSSQSGVVEAAFVKALNEVGQDDRGAKHLPDDLRSFIEFIGHELIDVYNNKASYKKCKREILQVIQNTIDENEIQQ